MKLTKTMAVVAVASALTLCPSGRAQSNGTNHARRRPPAGIRSNASVENQLERLDQRVHLTAEQKPKVKAVLEQQMNALHEARTAPAEERRAKFHAAIQERNRKLKEILTPEQFAKLRQAPPRKTRKPLSGQAPGANAGTQNQ